jgi:hypothetical protein
MADFDHVIYHVAACGHVASGYVADCGDVVQDTCPYSATCLRPRGLSDVAKVGHMDENPHCHCATWLLATSLTCQLRG